MAKKYILDTNIISYLVDDESIYSRVIEKKLTDISNRDSVGVSILTLYELSYGLEYATNQEQVDIFNNAISLIKTYLTIYDLRLEDMNIFAMLKKRYKNRTGIAQKALKKNDLDFLIASTALAQNAILISNDKIFETIYEMDSNLLYENWLR
jgi:predicted nucleic acid-binding protein